MRTVARVVLIVSLWTGTVRATEAQDRRAREVFAAGQEDFAAERYQDAYARFKEAYLLCHAPALLYNMASALEGSGRPHEAAEELRAYLRARPGDPEKGLIEGRIRALDEAQRLLDAERLKNERPKLLPLPAPEPRWTRRKTLATVLGAVGGVLVIGGLGVGLGLGLKQEYPASTLHTQVATP